MQEKETFEVVLHLGTALKQELEAAAKITFLSEEELCRLALKPFLKMVHTLVQEAQFMAQTEEMWAIEKELALPVLPEWTALEGEADTWCAEEKSTRPT